MIVVYALIGIGLFFSFLGVIGLYRFPDAYTRLHASTKCTTFGSLFLGLSIILYTLLNYSHPEGIIMVSRVFIVLVIIFITNATEGHAIARGAHRSGLKPVGEVDALAEEGNK